MLFESMQKHVIDQIVSRLKEELQIFGFSSVKVTKLYREKNIQESRQDNKNIIIKTAPKYLPVSLRQLFSEGIKNNILPHAFSISLRDSEVSLEKKELLKRYAAQVIFSSASSYAADRDLLTGFLNKNSILNKISAILDEQKNISAPDSIPLSSGQAKSFYLAILDIDDFKKFNSLYGYTVGDYVINTVSHILSSVFSSFKSSFYSGRYGGEEFIILFNAHDYETALLMVDSAREEVQKQALANLKNKINLVESLKLICRDIKLPVTVSSGLIDLKKEVLDSNGPVSPESIITKVSAALGVSKKTGKNRVVMFDDIIKNHCYVSEVLPDANQIRLNLGFWHGIRPNMCFKVIDASFNGKSAYFDVSGRERIGIRPKRVKGLVQVNSNDKNSLEIQENISFASIIKRTGWKICSGDRLRPVQTGQYINSEFIYDANKEDAQIPKFTNISQNRPNRKSGASELQALVKINVPLEMGETGLKKINNVFLDYINEYLRDQRGILCSQDYINGCFYLVFNNLRWTNAQKMFKKLDRHIKSSISDQAFINVIIHINEQKTKEPEHKSLNSLNENLSHNEFLQDFIASMHQIKKLFPFYHLTLWDSKSANFSGVTYYQANDLVNARRLFDKALLMDPENWHAHNNLANIFMSRDLFDKAEQEYKKAIEKSNEKMGVPVYNLAYLYLLKNSSLEKALDLLLKAKSLGIDDCHLYNQLALAVMLTRKDWPGALKYALKAVKKSSGQPEIIDTLIQCQLACKLYKDACESSEKLISKIDFTKPFNPEFIEHIVSACKNDSEFCSKLTDKYPVLNKYLKETENV
jgi:diguanylate cyclase (GGDEF)-like protein